MQKIVFLIMELATSWKHVDDYHDYLDTTKSQIGTAIQDPIFEKNGFYEGKDNKARFKLRNWDICSN